jgi:hypothetical protein
MFLLKCYNTYSFMNLTMNYVFLVCLTMLLIVQTMWNNLITVNNEFGKEVVAYI